jgi:predicted RNase H-like nuclease (RuvC/YqgF family)
VKVFGIDIIKGSVRSRTRRPVYALCRVEDGEVLGVEEVTGFRLQRLLAREEPDILAVDSLQEIAADQRELYAFLQSLPPATKLVQVTGGERPESLPKVAARYNISFNRFDPYAEARTTAQVASLGAGVEVIAFENTTDIVVSRHRSPGRGGWSQNRYARKIHGGVMQKAREIEARLRGAGLDYEKKETKAFGGYSRVAFKVMAAREMVPVHSSRGADVQVRVTGRELDRIRFEPRSSRPRYLIVGLDPGTTTGIAAVDLDGNLVLLTSSRQMTMSDIIEELYRAGKPLIIASDVQQMPYSVEKIRRAFNAIPYTPRQSLSVEAKYDLTAPFSYTNDHERDSLSAALDAYRSLQNKFRNIAKRVKPGVDLDEVRARVLRGQPLDTVLTDLQGVPAPEKPAAPPAEAVPERPVEDERVMALDGMVKRLRSYVQELQEDLRERDREIERLRQSVRRARSATEQKVRRDAELATKDATIESLREQLRDERRRSRRLKKRLERIQTVAEIEISEDYTPLKVLDSLTREGMRGLQEGIGISAGDVLYVPRAHGWGRGVVKDLAGTGVRALVIGGEETPDPHLVRLAREADLPLLPAETVGPEIRGRTGAAKTGAVEEAMGRWEEGQKEFRREQEAERVEYLFKEYRSEREKEVRRGG